MNGVPAERKPIPWLANHGPKEIELLLRAVLFHPTASVLLADDDRRYLEASFGAGKLFGHPREKLIGRKLDEFLDPGFQPVVAERWRTFLEKGEQVGTLPLMSAGGGPRIVDYSAKGNLLPLRHLLVLREKSAGTADAQPATVDQRTLNPFPAWLRDCALFLLDSDETIVAWYAGAERIYGYTSAEALGRPLSFLLPDVDILRVQVRHELTRASGEGHVGAEAWHKRKDGTRFWANVVTSAIKDEDEALQGFASVVRDFSDRHERDEALQRGPKTLRAMPPESTVMGIVTGEFDRIIEANDTFLAMVGCSYDDLRKGNLHWPDFTPPEYLRQIEVSHEEALRFGASTPKERHLLCQGGGRIHVRLAMAVLGITPFRWIAFVRDLRSVDRLESVEEEAADSPHNFPEIIDASTSMKRVMTQVEMVAPTDATVLILGETGTGKELIARAIHRMSHRGNLPFVTLNCAAIPTGLLESELFGYERGAFTGALQQKIGRFEMANRGTLFLDEVGDIPLELQPKLLRALQEKAFERLGGTKTIPIDVRLVAATNRNLTQMMGDKLFRSDLYYRLKVFPITTPPLRERPEDIPTLARYFTKKYAEKMNREITKIPSGAMRTLVSWPWPGNVRELENFIERSVILSPGPRLHAPIAELVAPEIVGDSTLEEMEREHILKVLRHCNGVVSTAATRLGLHRTTLNALMHRLGISRGDA
jgi:PAS domain S-box-containing protein